VNAGRNTYQTVPLPPTSQDPDELAEETSEPQFIQYVLAKGIPLADFEKKR
jgi:hypothetical protein